MAVIWSFPTRILFGVDAVLEIGNEILRLGGRHALIVTDAALVQSGVIDPVREVLQSMDVAYTVFAHVESNPLESHVEEAADAYRGSHSDFLIAIGGGSVIDVAKLVQLRATGKKTLAQIESEAHLMPRPRHQLPPMIAIPTTAGPGSEVTDSALVTLRDHANKTTFHARELVPTVAILDPKMTVGMPPRLTAATGFDALAHSIEAYCATGDHPMADAVALESIELIATALERAVHHGEDLEARGAMLKASMMGAVAAQKGLGAAHAIANPLGSEHHVHHGVAHAVTLPAVLDFNRTAIPRKIAKIARILGVRGNDIDTLSFECSGAIRQLRRKCHLPEHLHEVGVDEPALRRLAEIAHGDEALEHNPRPCTVEDFISICRASL